MRNQSSDSSIRVSFLKRRQNQLSAYLVNQMNMNQDLAHLMVRIHEPANINETLNLFLTDQNNIYNHVFIPKDNLITSCQICQSTQQFHREGNIEQIKKQIKAEIQEERSSALLLEDQLENQPRFTCQICYIEVIKNDIFTIKDEIHNICLQCMDSFIREEINNMRVQKISCPHCGTLISSEVIRDLIDSQTYNKYKLFLRNLEIQKSPNLKWCPNPKCSVLVNTNRDKKTSKCPKCQTQICNKCNRQAHPRSSCQSAFQKQIKDWENASDIQKCKKCQGMVQKIAGCNHMTCSICHYEWCWLCGSDYSTAHFSALNPFGCPGLQDRPRDDWGKCKILLLRIGLLLLIIIGIPIILPIIMAACGPVFVGNFLWNYYYPDTFCKKFRIVFLSLIIGLITNPIFWIGCIFYFIPIGIAKLFRWYRERRQNDLRREHFLQERLLQEEAYDQKIVDQ